MKRVYSTTNYMKTPEQEINAKLAEVMKYEGGDYADGWHDAIEYIESVLGLNITKSTRNGKSLEYDFSKFNYIHLPDGSYASFDEVSMTDEEFDDYVARKTTGKWADAVAIGSHSSRYCVILGHYTSTPHIEEFYFTDSLSDAKNHYNEWLTLGEWHGYHLATLLDMDNHKEIMYDRADSHIH